MHQNEPAHSLCNYNYIYIYIHIIYMCIHITCVYRYIHINLINQAGHLHTSDPSHTVPYLNTALKRKLVINKYRAITEMAGLSIDLDH